MLAPTAPGVALVDVVLPVSKSVGGSGRRGDVVLRLKNADGSVDRQLSGASADVAEDPNDPSLINFRFKAVPVGHYDVLRWHEPTWIPLVRAEPEPREPSATTTVATTTASDEDDADDEVKKPFDADDSCDGYDSWERNERWQECWLQDLVEEERRQAELDAQNEDEGEQDDFPMAP